MRIVVAAIIVFAASTARAGCMYTTDDCVTDSQGNYYTRQDGLTGGTELYGNDGFHSKYGHKLNGDYTETYSNGRIQTYGSDPYTDVPKRGNLSNSIYE